MKNLNEVKSVYSGKNGSCCCGCAGKYTYAKTHQVMAGKERGYAVSNEEVNESTVKRVYTKVQKLILEGASFTEAGNRVSVVEAGRLYVLYF